MSPKCRFGPSRQRSPRGHRGKEDRPRPPRTRAPAEKKQASREPAFEKMPNRRELRAAPCFRPKKINGRTVWLRERRNRRPPTRFKNGFERQARPRVGRYVGGGLNHAQLEERSPRYAKAAKTTYIAKMASRRCIASQSSAMVARRIVIYGEKAGQQ